MAANNNENDDNTTNNVIIIRIRSQKRMALLITMQDLYFITRTTW